MKVIIDGKEVFSLNETQKKVIQNDISSEVFQEDMERRVKYILEHKYNRCFDRLKKQWEPLLATRLTELPTDKDSLAEVIFSQPEYKNRSQRMAEEEE